MNNNTPLLSIYEKFLSKITDDMYLELTPCETENMLMELFESALHFFEFPRVDIYDYDKKAGAYNITLSDEEMNIIATYMVVCWLSQQLATIENLRMKYSGVDFKFTSQANHMAKIQQMKTDYTREGFHLQRLYKRRRKDENGVTRSTFDTIMFPR